MFRKQFGISSLKTCFIGRKYNCQETKPPVSWTDDNSESTLSPSWILRACNIKHEWGRAGSNQLLCNFFAKCTCKNIKILNFKIGSSFFKELFPYWPMANLLHIGNYFCRCLQILKIYYQSEALRSAFHNKRQDKITPSSKIYF